MVALPSVGAAVERLPLHRDTELGGAGTPAAVILVPEQAEYRELGRHLSDAVVEVTGVRLPVETAAEYVNERPRVVKPERLDRHFILLGQFWNNAVLERLYCGYFDPTDGLFPGPGGYELRTVCSPFRSGHNCVVLTGSDLGGCRKAVEQLPELIRAAGEGSHIPFLHRVELTGEAAEVEAKHRERLDGMLPELDRYATFGHPEAKSFTGGDTRDFLDWKDRNLAMAAVLGVRFWATGAPQDAEAFKRLVFGCAERLDLLKQLYSQGRGDLIEYSLDALVIAWDLIEETDAFTDEERRRITDYLHELASLSQNAYFVYKCKDVPVTDVHFHNRHQIAGTMWLGLHADYLRRNCRLTDREQALADEWAGHARRYLERLVQSYFYADGVQLLNDEGGLVLRWALMTGRFDYADNGALRLLADYWVANNDNLGRIASSGHVAGTRHAASGGEVLNAAGWLYPNEGYRWFRERLPRWPYDSFLLYMGSWSGLRLPWFNFEMPPGDDGSAKLRDRVTGLSVLPLGEAFDAYLRRYPERWRGGYQRVDGRYLYEPMPYERSWKRISLRSGFEPTDQYLVLDGLQGIEWSYDDINAIVRYDDLGEHLLKSQWDARSVESRLEMNTLFVSNGRPGAKQSVASELVRAADVGPHALVSVRANRHGGVSWTRHLFWRKERWLLVADEVLPETDGRYFLAQTWLSHHPFEIDGAEATAQANEVTLHIVGTPDRKLVPCDEGVRQTVHARLGQGRPFVLWTLIYASGPERRIKAELARVHADVVRVAESMGDRPTRLMTASLRTRVSGPGLLTFGGAPMLLSTDRVVFGSGCELSMGGMPFVSAADGSASWDLLHNGFDRGKQGFGLGPYADPSPTIEHYDAARNAFGRPRPRADATGGYMPPEVTRPRLPGVAEAGTPDRLHLDPPLELVTGRLSADGQRELLLHDAQGRLRFPVDSITADPVAVDFDGNGQRDIAVAAPGAITVYRADGSVRWERELTSRVGAMSAGDVDGDGREELGLTQHNWATVLNHAGERLIDEEIYRYTGIGAAFGDVDGDGQEEFVAVTASGVNVLQPGHTRRTVGFGSFFGVAPCRVWLRDLDGDGALECYLGGGGSDVACYDLKAMRCRWAFSGAPVHPRDAALCDLDADGTPEIVSGGGDGFLYVVNADGGFVRSRSVGAGVTSLLALPPDELDGDLLAVGLETGEVLTLLGQYLAPTYRARIGDSPVRHLALLSEGAARVLIAADENGQAVRIRLLG